MRGFVANTHHDWFDFLAREKSWDEVNFWNPSSYYTFRGEPGSPFFFRLKSPRNAIGGFGIVSRFDKLEEWLAWECFEQGNGAETVEVFQARLRELRRANKIADGPELPQIGCIILSTAVFFSEELWVRQPTDWGRQNLRYKTYDLSTGEGLRIWMDCLDRCRSMAVGPLPFDVKEDTPRYGPPLLVRPRVGQGTFRLAVTAAYSRSCAITGEHSLPALEASHIRPYSEGGEHAVRNGILLRSDLHRLFDLGYITITPEYRLEVTNRLRTQYENGHTYYPLAGRDVRVPRSPVDRPSVDYLKWHNEAKFK